MLCVISLNITIFTTKLTIPTGARSHIAYY